MIDNVTNSLSLNAENLKSLMISGHSSLNTTTEVSSVVVFSEESQKFSINRDRAVERYFPYYSAVWAIVNDPIPDGNYFRNCCCVVSIRRSPSGNQLLGGRPTPFGLLPFSFGFFFPDRSKRSDGLEFTLLDLDSGLD
jgi:hypothetical protein